MAESANLSRRDVLMAVASGAVAVTLPVRALQNISPRAEAFPLSAVRLKTSIFLNAVTADRAYLLSLEPDRLLHHFHRSAGLEPKGLVYGGWESRGIAGHTLGHYLSACSLMHAQTGDRQCTERVAYSVDELARCQEAHGDGYVGGTTVERDGKVLDGKIVFQEVKRGEIHSAGFDLNGGWVPLYTWHKVHAGLLDAHHYCANETALKVAVKMAGFLANVFDALSDDQMQQVLACEHGGLNEAYAETFARTGDARWLQLAQRIYHRKVLDPLVAGRDELQGLHANTQIPKLIGLARLYELTGDSRYSDGARFFWNTVTRDHSYVIGGNSEREHFGTPRVLSTRLTDQTCEACNTYNMLKLTRHLYAWQPDASYFDYYERAHLNHTLSHQDPATGMFTYMTPMMSGMERKFSTPTEDFWCCVGSGMESHAKHGESIYWRIGDTLLVNLYYASQLEWSERGARFELDTTYPESDRVRFTIVRAGLTAGPDKRLNIAFRIPGSCPTPGVVLNGKPVRYERSGGYATLKRAWHDGDVIELTLPMTLRVESTADNPRMVAFLSGPLVLAADLGAATEPHAADDLPPAIVAANVATALKPLPDTAHTFTSGDACRPRPVEFRPFFSQYHRRTALYFPTFSESEWAAEKTAFTAAQRQRAALDARTVDRMYLGEMQPERDHALTAEKSDPVSYLGRRGRVLRPGGFFEFTMAAQPGPLLLQAVYWGEDRNSALEISIDGVLLATENLAGGTQKRFEEKEYPVPAELLRDKPKVTVRFASRTDRWVSVYGCRLLKAVTV